MSSSWHQKKAKQAAAQFERDLLAMVRPFPNLSFCFARDTAHLPRSFRGTAAVSFAVCALNDGGSSDIE